MTDQDDEQHGNFLEEPVEQERREFLRGLGKWSQAVIGGVLLGGAATLVPQARAGAWINRRGGYGGGGWINGGGGGWINRRGGYGGGSWINRRGGYGGGSWINRRW
ncbi:MAG: twin-arginine translocation signal domain-containing protein [Gammaproteobacteria bacterium]|nr:twin-arginine translocation signal domain-containing protein [Gammaproteobacteria bacterium]